MKILEDIWSSFSGNAKTRVNDPFIGAFAASWVACNWSSLAILFWGEGSASDRIKVFSLYLSEMPWLAFNSIVFYPLVLAAFYLFLFPWVSWFLKGLQKAANDRLHKQAIDIELNKAGNQEKLNKVRLMSNPDKQFLEQSVQLDIDRRKEIIEILKSRAARAKERAEESAARALEAASKASAIKLDEESKQRQAKIERDRFNANSAKLRASLASNRFPSAYLFISRIDSGLAEAGVRISLSAAGKVVAAIFGYNDFQDLIEDERFNNEVFSKVEYIFYDPEALARKLEIIVVDERSDNGDLTSDLLFDCSLTMFDDLPYRLISQDDLEEICMEFFELHKFDLLDFDGVSGAIADSDTVFDDVEFDSLESVQFYEGVTAVIHASAGGGHRNDGDIPGRDMSISIEVKSTLQVGRYALGALQFGEVSGELIDFYDEEDERR